MVSPAKTRRPQSELAQAVYRSVYHSRAQRGTRLAAMLLLASKHILRGLLFSWPLYLMALAGFYAPFPVSLILWVIAIPGIGLSLFILGRGVLAEIRERITGKILKQADLVKLLKGGSTT